MLDRYRRDGDLGEGVDGPHRRQAASCQLHRRTHDQPMHHEDGEDVQEVVGRLTMTSPAVPTSTGIPELRPDWPSGPFLHPSGPAPRHEGHHQLEAADVHG